MKVLLTAVVAALVLASGASSAAEFTLRPVAQTARTVTLSWQRQPGADGYALIRNGAVVARTMAPSKTSATFWRGTKYAVAVLHVAPGGKVTTGPRAVYFPARRAGTTRLTRLVFVPAPSPRFALRVVDRTPKTVTFAWRPQPGADGYQFVRDGAVIARTMSRAKTTATFWRGSRYAVDVIRLSDKAIIPVRRAGAFVPRASTHAKATRAGIVLVPAPRIDFRLRLVGSTKRTVTFAWKRQPGVDGYRFLRNGVRVAQTFVRSTTRVTFWKGTRYEVQALRRAAGTRVTPIMKALAFTTSAPTPTRRSGGGGGGSQPSGPGVTAPSTGGAKSGTAPKSPESPKSPAAPKPPTTSKPPAKPSAPPPSPPTTEPPPATPLPPPPVGPGGVVTLSGSYSPSAFFQAVAVAPAGPVTARGPFTVTGDISVRRAGLRIENATVQGTVDFDPGSNGSSFVNGSAESFGISGADDVLVQGSTFDGHGVNTGNSILDEPAGSTPDGFRIVGNTFRNFYRDDGSHSEALYVGYSTNGLIEGNTFTNNGNTAHVFFTWFGSQADPSSSYPRNICVRGNTFNQTHGAYYAVDIRAEIPSSTGIDVEPGSNRVTADIGLSSSSRIVRNC
jgi:hypothetical protein